MATMNISLPDAMKEFVEEQTTKGGFSTVSEYVRTIIREAQEREIRRQEVRNKLLEAVRSGPATPMTSDDWEGIRQEVRKRHAQRQGENSGRRQAKGR
jgi:antitoxin ParD1/3/4